MTLTYKQKLGEWWTATAALFCMTPIYWLIFLEIGRFDLIIGTAILAGILIFVPPGVEKIWRRL